MTLLFRFVVVVIKRSTIAMMFVTSCAPKKHFRLSDSVTRFPQIKEQDNIELDSLEDGSNNNVSVLAR